MSLTLKDKNLNISSVKEGEIFDQFSPLNRRPIDVVREKYPEAVQSVVAAFGIAYVYYKEVWGIDQVATLYYTNIADLGSVIGVKTKLIFEDDGNTK